LTGVFGAFLEGAPAWRLVHSDKRAHAFYVGRDIAQVFVHFGFSARTDREVFGQSVGWAPNLEAFKASLARRETPPLRLRDGRLKRIRILEKPRDFEYEELSFPTSSLVRPVSGYRAEESNPDEIKAQMLADINDYGLPYLCLMLERRFWLVFTPAQLMCDAAP
jgi:hypothetical protein